GQSATLFHDLNSIDAFDALNFIVCPSDIRIELASLGQGHRGKPKSTRMLPTECVDDAEFHECFAFSEQRLTSSPGIRLLKINNAVPALANREVQIGIAG